MAGSRREVVPPLLFVVSGPSGSGKGEAIRILTEQLDLARTTTYTTRPARPGEVDGRNYWFLSLERFWALESEGRFLEYNQTYGSHIYASPAELRAFGDSTPDAVVELDPDGYQLVRRFSARRVIGLFLLPPSIDTLMARINERSPEADLDERMEVARRQLAQAWNYDQLLVNESLGELEDDLRACVETYRSHQRATRHLLSSLAELRRHRAMGGVASA